MRVMPCTMTQRWQVHWQQGFTPQRRNHIDITSDDKTMSSTMTMWMTLADLSPNVSCLLQATFNLKPYKLVASQSVQNPVHDKETDEEVDEWNDRRNDHYTAAIFLWPGEMLSFGWWKAQESCSRQPRNDCSPWISKCIRCVISSPHLLLCSTL